jgi:hypothetical protein
MQKNILFFLAGWFSACLGFVIAPVYGNVAFWLSFVLLTFVYRKDAT